MTKSELKAIIAECYDEVMNEGLFSHKPSTPIAPYRAYYSHITKRPIGEKEYGVKESIKESIIYTISIFSNSTYKSEKLEIPKSKKSILQKTIYTYLCNNVKYTDEYGYSMIGNTKELIFEGSAKDALEKYNIEYSIKDTSSIERERKAAYSKAIKIASEVLANAKKLPEWDRCYGVASKSSDKDEYEEFILGNTDHIEIINYDIYDNNKHMNSRDYANSDEFVKLFKYIDKNLKTNIERNIKGYTSEYYGDWDDGPFVLKAITKKK